MEELDLVSLGSLRRGLERLGPREAVTATCYVIQISLANFYAIFELYCPATWTFFTPVGELSMALHEMWEVSTLPMGSLSYEEYLSRADVPLLHLLRHAWQL